MSDKVILTKCPICNKDARTIDSRNEVGESLTGCDSNEFYKCFTAKDNSSLRYLQRQREPREIDWSQVK